MVIKYSREENIKILMNFLKMVSNIDTTLNLFSAKIKLENIRHF